MDLTLYVADDNGLINLAGIVPPGAHYTATRNENSGVVRLVPVKVATTAVKASGPGPDREPESPDGPTPWGQ